MGGFDPHLLVSINVFACPDARLHMGCAYTCATCACIFFIICGYLPIRKMAHEMMIAEGS